jgi:predicted amidohydrolase YtcJ
VAIYPDVLIDREFIKSGVSRTYVQRMRIAGAKLTIDGSPQGLTAWRDRPYYKPLGNYPPGYSGYAAASADDVMSAVSWAAENGIHIITHCNGERASDLLIASHRAAQARFPTAKATRPVLTHGQFLREDQLDSFKVLDVIPSLFRMHTFLLGRLAPRPHRRPRGGHEHLAHRLGAQARDDLHEPSRRAGGVSQFDARARCHRHAARARGSGRIVGPQHRVDVITGLKARTIWPAYQIFEEETKGSLEVGKLADFAILSKDPTAVAPTTIADIQVTETIKEGAAVFRLAPEGGKTASDRTSESFARMLHAMAHPAPTAGTALLPGSAQLRARMMANMPPGEGNLCQADVITWLADAMARGG